MQNCDALFPDVFGGVLDHAFFISMGVLMRLYWIAWVSHCDQWSSKPINLWMSQYDRWMSQYDGLDCMVRWIYHAANLILNASAIVGVAA
jgi:hypothetical protein